ncbi:hypothetical protein [Accumulibacter sp.]|uniref:hypothetical protein n=1 Tax=Accumulibacter sp. TaxID=2053492 RepID=UPI0025EB35D8|nr:hypothetical protein [Accumulibacter sp.]MCM8594974.1 hypothetical protein [Accumulibacter sp.]MCM8627297.1 hypothetical protein [Accumulibacter sp.]MDS4049120.1 hypothetical protein [Accumulibacter sp.]
MFVRCEKLILVSDPPAGEWWRRLLDPRDRPFSGGGRCASAGNPEDAVAMAIDAREAGFRPILICASPAVRERLRPLLRERRLSVSTLVRGYDDAAIRALLRSPSREVLLALAGQYPLIEPSREYMDALDSAVARDPAAQRFIHKAREVDLQLDDFTTLDEEEESVAVVRTHRLAWRLDPARCLTIALDPLRGDASCRHTLAGRPQPGSLHCADGEWRFDEHGEYSLSGQDLRTIAETFAIDDEWLRRWDEINRGLFLPPEMLANVQSWTENPTRSPFVATSIARAEETPRVLLNSAQWKAAFDALMAEPLAEDAGSAAGTRSGSPARLPVNRVAPLLLAITSGPDLTLDLLWPAADRELNLPEGPPGLSISIDGRKVEAPDFRWQDGYRRLVVAGIDLPPACRYGWEWDAGENTLRVEVESARGRS